MVWGHHCVWPFVTPVDPMLLAPSLITFFLPKQLRFWVDRENRDPELD